MDMAKKAMEMISSPLRRPVEYEGISGLDHAAQASIKAIEEQADSGRRETPAEVAMDEQDAEDPPDSLPSPSTLFEEKVNL